MRVITASEARYLRESRQRLLEAGILISVPRTRRLTRRQFNDITEAVLFTEAHRREMQRLGLPINEELQLEFLAAIAQGAATVARAAAPAVKAAGQAVAKGAKVAGQAAMKGAKAAGQAAAKAGKAVAQKAGQAGKALGQKAGQAAQKAGQAAKGVADKAGKGANDLMTAMENSPEISDAIQKAANSQKKTAADAKKTVTDVQSLVKQLPPEQQSAAKKASGPSLDQMKASVQKSFEKMSGQMGDPELAKVMISAALMQLVNDMSK